MDTAGFPLRKINKHGRWEKLTINDISDGEQRHWPAKPYRSSADEGYLIESGNTLAEVNKVRRPGIGYYVNKLPDGYATFEIEQPGSGGKVQYKRLFGHPSGKYFDSAVRWTEHFRWLQNGMVGDCECHVCGNRKPAVMSAGPKLQHKSAGPKSKPTQEKPQAIPMRLPRQSLPDSSGASTRDSSAGGIATNRARREAKATGASYAVDEEGTEDIYKKFLQQLEKTQFDKRGIDFDIEEENSLDWRAIHDYKGYGANLLPASITQIEQQHSFIPRVGELVLWCPNFPDDHYLMLNTKTSQYMFYSFDQQAWHGLPDWRAGVITAVPTKSTENGPIDFTDILDLPKKETALNISGFRVETSPDPNDPCNKGISKQYKFVPLRNIRPLSHWQSLLRKVPEKNMHPSIKHAFKCMTSISLLEKVKGIGRWPHAGIECRGAYLGAELITTGDVIRLCPVQSGDPSTEVMIVDSIRLYLDGIKSEHTAANSPQICSQSLITFQGSAFTLDEHRHYKAAESAMDNEIQITPIVPLEKVKTMFRPVGSAEYGTWFELHHPRQKLEVSHEQVLGRLYEADAVRLWTGQLQHKLRKGQKLTQKPSLNFDVSGIQSARLYATKTDARLPEANDGELKWFWADTRAEALAVETFNGIEVGNYDQIRTHATLDHWQAQMALINGKSVTAEASKFVSFAELGDIFSSIPSDSKTGRRVGRKPGSRVINGRVVYPGDPDYPDNDQLLREDSEDLRPRPTSTMAGAAFVSTDEEETDDDDLEVVNVAGDTDGENLLRGLTGGNVPKKERPEPKKVLTKVDIMQSVEDADEFEDDIDSEDEGWLQEPIPLARGGTEESEGGDYDPKHSQRQNGRMALVGGSRKEGYDSYSD